MTANSSWPVAVLEILRNHHFGSVNGNDRNAAAAEWAEGILGINHRDIGMKLVQ